MRRRLGRIRRAVQARVRDVRDRRRHAAIRAAAPATGRPAVFYGHDRIPRLDEPAHGGTVKFQQLQRELPNEPRAFNLLYVGSSTRPPDSSALIRLARDRGVPIVVNQDGVAYPAWHGPGWERTNEPLAELVHAADHVLYQSAFSKRSSDRFLGDRAGPWEILYNPVDTERFVPGEPRARPLTLLLGGNQHRRHRFESAVAALARIDGARLVVAGRIAWHPDARIAQREAAELLAAAGVGGRVELVGTFTQRDAPALYQRADLLVHPQYNDPCPTVVLEAMASGLPVVFSASGGTPELVGDAGVGVPAPEDFEHEHASEPEALVRAILEAAERRGELAAAARQRALDHFDLKPWIERHRRLFAELTS